MKKEFNSKVWSDADDLAEYYWAVQIEADSKVHPELQNDDNKLKIVLAKWTKEFYKLLNKEQPPISEVEKVIRFVQYGKYFTPAKYSAGYLCSKYVKIREVMECIEAQPYVPEF